MRKSEAYTLFFLKSTLFKYRTLPHLNTSAAKYI